MAYCYMSSFVRVNRIESTEYSHVFEMNLFLSVSLKTDVALKKNTRIYTNINDIHVYRDIPAFGKDITKVVLDLMSALK